MRNPQGKWERALRGSASPGNKEGGNMVAQNGTVGPSFAQVRMLQLRRYKAKEELRVLKGPLTRE